MHASVGLIRTLMPLVWITIQADSSQLDFWYTNHHERIKVVVDESAKEIRVSRIVGGQFTGKVERYGIDDFAMLTNSFARDGLALEVDAEPEPAAVKPARTEMLTHAQAPEGSHQPSEQHHDTQVPGQSAEGSWIIVVLALCLYFLPTLVAGINKKRNGGAILILNLFLGWTLLGWVLALVWAACKDPSPT